MNHTNEIYELFEHSYRVSKLSLKMAHTMGLSELKSREIAISGFFHDLGKLKLDQYILNKSEKLSKTEFEHIKNHSTLGYKIAMKLPFSKDILESILQHHENYDGTGYPLGIKENEINIGARIIKVCDVFDALISDRPYRKGHSFEEALALMEKFKLEYDPYIFNVFKKLVLNDYHKLVFLKNVV